MSEQEQQAELDKLQQELDQQNNDEDQIFKPKIPENMISNRKQAQKFFVERGIAFLLQPLQTSAPKCEISLNFELKSTKMEDIVLPEHAALILKYSALNKKSIAFSNISATPFAVSLQQPGLECTN